MTQFLLSFEQISTALRLAALDPVPGAPLEGVGVVRLNPGDDGFRQLAANGLVLNDDGAWRVNRAFALALAVSAAPGEAVWIETDHGRQRLTLARRGAIAAECTVRPDGIVRLEFPQVWSLLDELLNEAFCGSQEGVGGIDFEFRGPAEEAFVLSLITDAALHDPPCRLAALQPLVDRALADPTRTLPFVRLGCADALLDLMPERSSVSNCIMSLMASGLIQIDNGVLLPAASAVSALKMAGPTTDLSIRRRVFTPTGHATIGVSAVRSGGTIGPGQAELHWRSISRSELAGEARDILGLEH